MDFYFHRVEQTRTFLRRLRIFHLLVPLTLFYGLQVHQGSQTQSPRTQPAFLPLVRPLHYFNWWDNETVISFIINGLLAYQCLKIFCGFLNVFLLLSEIWHISREHFQMWEWTGGPWCGPNLGRNVPPNSSPKDQPVEHHDIEIILLLMVQSWVHYWVKKRNCTAPFISETEDFFCGTGLVFLFFGGNSGPHAC
jgi:hypothetical protein